MGCGHVSVKDLDAYQKLKWELEREQRNLAEQRSLIGSRCYMYPSLKVIYRRNRSAEDIQSIGHLAFVSEEMLKPTLDDTEARISKLRAKMAKLESENKLPRRLIRLFSFSRTRSSGQEGRLAQDAWEVMS